MTFEIRDIEQKRLYVTAKKYEKKYGKSIYDILLEIIYGDDPSTALEGIKLFFRYMLTSEVDSDWMQEVDEPGHLISLDLKDDSE